MKFKPFYFIRHGETDWNKQRLCMGNTDIPLNIEGVHQATTVLDTLKGTNINFIITSPLLRAQQTAKIIGTFYGIPIEINDHFKEANWGELQGKPKGSEENFIRWRNGLTPKGAETFEEMKQRIFLGLNTVLLKENSISLIVGHGGTYWGLTEILNLPFHDIGNCEVIYFTPYSSSQGPWFSSPLNI